MYTPSIVNKLWFSGTKMHSVSTAETQVPPRRAEPKEPQRGENAQVTLGGNTVSIKEPVSLMRPTLT